jgi:prenyltransferase/squalene oxidase-like repeat protein
MASGMRSSAWVPLLSCATLALSSTRPSAAERRPEGVTPEIERMIAAGVNYLVRTQNRDGSWNNMGGWGTYPTAMTALAGTGILMSGSTPTQGPHARSVRKAAEFLMSVAQPGGLIATPAEEGRSLHGHGFAMMFLAQVYGMEEDRSTRRRLHDVLTRAVRITERSQSRAGGWLYSPNSDGDEGSVTVTQIQGLRACRDAGIQVNPNTVRNAVRYIERSSNPDGGIRYNIHPGESRPPITAAAVATLYNAGGYDSPLALKCLAFCDRTVSVNAGGSGIWGHFYYSHLYYAQAKYQRGNKDWDRYYRAMTSRLASSQQSDGSWTGDDVGTSYGTSIALIILGLPYQNVPIFQR